MKKIAIVFHSAKGHTRELARAIHGGMSENNAVKCQLFEIQPKKDLPWRELHQADVIIFGSPTFMGTVSAPFKDFMDKTSEFWLQQPWKNKLAAGFSVSTSFSGDKFSTLSALMVFAMQHGMIWVGLDHVGSIHTGDGLGLNELGSWTGLMARSNPDKNRLLYDGDRNTAKYFGKRIASIASDNLAIKSHQESASQLLPG